MTSSKSKTARFISSKSRWTFLKNGAVSKVDSYIKQRFQTLEYEPKTAFLKTGLPAFLAFDTFLLFRKAPEGM